MMSTPRRSRSPHPHQVAIREVPLPAPFQLPDNRQPARSLTDLLTGASLTTLRCCTQPGRFTKLSRKNIASWSQSTASLGHTHWRPGCNSSRYASPCGLRNVNSCFRRFRARFSRASPPVCWQVGPWPLSVSTSATAHSLWNPGRVGSGAPHGVSLARFGLVSSSPEFTWGKAAVAQSISSGIIPLTLPTTLFLIFLPQSV